ncbi:VOC family protein [Halorussus halophilus]|uniref:VOC family protein n=1 Tax=Halorussus halophilus TaxID=2650975 RepID=UPI0013010945|nr:VOC family protein [Halorussus halophilus]
MTHAFNWVEIPSTDFDRAVEFYSTVLDREVAVYEPETDKLDNQRAGMFDTDEGETGGMIVETDEFTTESGATVPYVPTADSGLVVYLTVGGDFDDALSRVESAGGEILVPKEPIPDSDAHYAIVTDTEGNRIGLMSAE